MCAAQVIPIRDLRSWRWLPNSHSLLVMREDSLKILDVDAPLGALPTVHDQGTWTFVAQLQARKICHPPNAMPNGPCHALSCW